MKKLLALLLLPLLAFAQPPPPTTGGLTVQNNNGGTPGLITAPVSGAVFKAANGIGDLTNPMTTLGDTIYGAASGVPTRLAGNTTATKLFSTQTGTGAVSAVPAWAAIVNGDIPTALTGKTYNGLTLTSTTGTLTIPNGASLITAGAFAVTLTATNTTGLTLPTTGTLATLAGSEAFTNKTYNGNTWTAGTGTFTQAASSSLITSGAFAATFTFTGTTGVTFPTSGTLATVAGTVSNITGTANEIAASASTGAVTLSLPTALTFTGKTVTGGTFSTPAITTPAFTGAFSGTYSLGGTPTINVAAAVGGTWTAAATWTLPAHTLGGMISGGGNQINNVVIGTTTPLAGAFTTLSATGALTYGGVTLSAAVTGTGNMVLSASPTFTGTVGVAAIRPTGDIRFNGTDNYIYTDSGSSLTGIEFSQASNLLNFFTTNVIRASISSSGVFTDTATSATTNDQIEIGAFKAISSGTAAIGFGPKLRFYSNDSAGTMGVFGEVAFKLESNTATNWNSTMILRTRSGGSFADNFMMTSAGVVTLSGAVPSTLPSNGTLVISGAGGLGVGGAGNIGTTLTVGGAVASDGTISVRYSNATADAYSLINTNTGGHTWVFGDGAGSGTTAGTFAISDVTGSAATLRLTTTLAFVPGSLTMSGTLTGAATLTGTNAINSAAATALTLGTASFGTSVSFASATGIPTFNTTINATSISVGGSAVTMTAANSVSPTSPNRTITITYGGTTYYLAAKTTND